MTGSLATHGKHCRSSHRTILITFVSVIVARQNVFAFEAASHEAVSMTALSGLTMQANQALRRLLNGKDVADVSGWAHRVTEKYPLTGPLHYQMQPTCSASQSTASNIQIERTSCSTETGLEKGCLLEALTYFFYRLTAPEKNTKPRNEASPVTDTTAFMFPHRISTTDADAVKYVINLIGDLHQPLHWGSQDDSLGKKILIDYEHDGERRQTSLWHFFEGAFVDKIMRERQTFWFSGWTHVNTIKSFYEEEKSSFNTRKEGSFLVWARENRSLLCSEVYPLLARLKKMPGNQEIYIVDRAAEFLIFEILKKRILLAGARVAVVMNHILQLRGMNDGLGQLGAGSGMEDVHETAEPGPGTVSETYVYLKNFLINLSIFIVVVLFFLYISRFYRSTPNTTAYSPASKAPEAAEMREAKAN